MINRTTKLRWRRGFRRRQRQLEDIGSQTEEQLDRHFFRRLGRLYEVRRFILTWLFLTALLAGTTFVQTRALGGYYQEIKPLAGGIFSEGIVGTFTNANPIYATSEADTAVSRLVFSSLFTYGPDNQLVPDLAKSIKVNDTGETYSVVLRGDAKWHDNRPLTAEDVVYTYRTIQNPDAKSPYFAAWKGVKISAKDEHTVLFRLPNELAAFPHSLTTGLLPRHLLVDVEPSSLRSSLFNTTTPVGSGAFKWNGVEVRGNSVEDREQRVSLAANSDYYTCFL